MQIASNGLIYLAMNPVLSNDNKVVLLTYQNNKWDRINNINLERSDVGVKLFKLWNNQPVICTTIFDTLFIYKYDQNQLTSIANYYLDNGTSPNLSFQNNYILLSFIFNDQLFVKKFQNGLWSNLYHTIRVNNINEYFIYTRLVELSNKTVLVAYGNFDNTRKLFLLYYPNTNLNSDSLTLVETKYLFGFIGIGFKYSGDYCIVNSNDNKLEFISNNPTYPWVQNKDVIYNICFGANNYVLTMTKDFLPIVPHGHNSIIVSDTISYLDKSILGELKATKSILRKNSNGDHFLLLVTTNCNNSINYARVYKYSGSNWLNIGNEIIEYPNSIFVMEIDPVSNMPIIGIGRENSNKILHLVNNHWTEVLAFPLVFNNNYIQDIKFDRNSRLSILINGINPAVIKIINGEYVNVSSNYIKDNVDLVEQSKIFMDKNFDAFIVGVDKSTQEFKILVMRENGWDSLKMFPFKRTFPEAYYDLQFDAQNRLHMLYRYYNRRNISNIIRYNKQNQTWEEPFDGIASVYDPNMNFFFDRNDMPYISFINQNNNGNIRLLQYKTIWDDVPNVKLNKGKTDYINTYRYNNETFFCFSNVTNHVVRLNDDLLCSTNSTRTITSNHIIFPNPVSNYIYVKSTLNNISIAKLRILNAIGLELMSSTNLELEDKIDVSNLSNGWYVLEITDNQKYISSHKIFIDNK